MLNISMFKVSIIFLLGFALMTDSAHAGDTIPSTRKLGFELATGLYIGGEINRDNFIFDHGFGFSISPLYQFTGNWRAGLTTGLIYTDHYNLLSAGLMTRFYTRSDATSFFLEFSGGYSDAWKPESNASNYRITGGWFMQPGIGYQVLLSRNLRGNLSFHMMHQSIDFVFDHPVSGHITSGASLDFLIFRAGLMF